MRKKRRGLWKRGWPRLSEEDFFSREHKVPDIASLPPVQIRAEELPPFPFTAMVGQEMMLKATLVTLANPSIRGLIIAGDRETGKATCLRSATALLPMDVPVVEMPLNVTKARLFGTKGRGGIIEQVSGGYLIVERINLFDDATSEKILSLASEKGYTLLATANMEDGGLPEGLASSSDMVVMVDSIVDIEERIEILKRLEEYRRDMKGFYSLYSGGEDALRNRLLKARDMVHSLELPKETLKSVDTLCKTRKSPGKKESLEMAAASNAALDGRTWADVRDVKDVASLVLS